MGFNLSSDLITKVCKCYHLGELLELPVLIPGGKVHQVWKLHTQSGFYALKRLEIPPNDFQSEITRYNETEKIASQFYEKNIPMTPAIDCGHHPVCVVDGNGFILFKWVLGKKLLSKEITHHQAAQIGHVLVNLHHAHLSPNEINLSVLNDRFYNFSFSPQHWDCLFSHKRMNKIAYAELFQKIAPLIFKVCEKVAQANQVLSSDRVISHRDVSPNNVIWTVHRSPVVIDWELAGLIHPTVDLLGAAFDWSIVGPNKISEKRFEAVVSAYKHAGGKIVYAEEVFFALMGIWFSWMELNLERFVYHKNLVEKHLGEREAVHTLLAFTRVYPHRAQWEWYLFPA